MISCDQRRRLREARTRRCLLAAALSLAAAPQAHCELVLEPLYKALGFGFAQDVVQSRLAPNNELELVSYRANLELRPDLSVAAGERVRATLKPRARLSRRWWREGLRDGDQDLEGELYLNEANVTVGVHETLFLIGGRENVQWGPSYLISPSNPFLSDNGRTNPKVEVPGLEYLRAVWIPSHEWTFAALANLGQGRSGEDQGLGAGRPTREFEPAYALKIDYTTSLWYGSLIAAHREQGESSLGFFAVLNATDAWLLYAEGQVRDEDRSLQLLLGASYTLRGGTLLTAELYYNRDGCEEALGPCIAQAEGDTVLVRRRYFLAQYTRTELFGTTDLTARLTHNIDDGSSRLIAIVEHDVNDYAQLFAVANLNLGHELDEFRSLVRYSLMLGLELTY